MKSGQAGFRLYTCNNLEDLAKAYSDARREEPLCFRGAGGVFARESIAVATRGMSIWLEQYLIRHGHVIAGMDFPFLRNAIDQILDQYAEAKGLKEATLTEQFKEDVLVWRIYRLLCRSSFMDKPGMAGLHAYLTRHADGGSSELRRYELSVKLANLFYLYMSFLPEVLHPEVAGHMCVESSDIAHGWQLVIWRELCRECDGKSPARLMLSFLREPRESLARIGYEPMTFFGISAMPPYFLKLLKKLSAVTAVNFFYLNYCDEFWGTVKSSWELRQELRKDVDALLDTHYNNTMLGNFGIQGRQFFNALLDLKEEGVDERCEPSLYSDQPKASTLLEYLQREIRNNVEEDHAFELDDCDDSLTFHSCFHMTREVEVLHDCLLKLIERSQPTKQHLQMNDIIVMAPNIGDYAASIHCVFDQGPLRGKYSISDRSVQKANLLAASFMDILSLSRGNFEYSRVTSLLGTDGLRNRFGITVEDAEILRNWLIKAKIRHGSMEIPGMPEGFSWRQGLDRFLMKIALDAPSDRAGNPLGLGQILPADIGTDGESLTLLGRLCALMEALTDLVTVIRTEHKNGPEWCDFLLEQVPRFFQADSDCSEDYAALVRALRELGTSMRLSGLEQDGVLPFEVVEDALSGMMNRPAQGDPFLSGKITFCSLLPMRGIPRRVIAILGMDSGKFPRTETKVGFNLLTHPLQGGSDYNLLKYYDRSSVVEDNFTFLEAIMSAQEHLMLFFKGKDPLTMKPAPRAIPVDVLYENVCRAVVGGATSAEKLMVEHSLNSYDPTAFRHESKEFPVIPEQKAMTLRNVFSYGVGAQLVAGRMAEGRQPSASLALWQDMKELPLPRPLPFKVVADSEQDGRRELTVDVTLKELEQFFKSPSEKFLQRGMGFSPNHGSPSAESDYESYRTTDWEKGSLRKRIASVQSFCGDSLPLLGSSGSSSEPMKVLRQRLGAANALPLGVAGDLEFKQLQQDSWLADEDFRRQYCQQEQGKPMEVDVAMDFPGQGDMPGEVTELVGIPFGDDVTFHVRLLGYFRYWQESSTGVCGFMTCEQHSIVPFLHPWGIWIRHLMLCAAYPDREVVSVAWGNPTGSEEKECVRFKRPALPMLEHLLRVYVWGLVRPMPLFERNSWQFGNLKNLEEEIGRSSDSRLLWGQQARDLESVVQVLAGYCSGCEEK